MELPVIIEEMEPESVGAKAISFNDTADPAFYRGGQICHLLREDRDPQLDPSRPDFADASEGIDLTADWRAGMSKWV